MSVSYRLHYAPDNASLVVRLALEELNVPYNTFLVDRLREGQKDPEYLKLNPNGLIPVLETDQCVLFETAAILLWLVDRHNGLGPSPLDPGRGRFLKWLFFVSNTLHPAMRMMFYPTAYVGHDSAAQIVLKQVSVAERIRFLDMLEVEASRADGCIGSDMLNVLDLYIAASLRWMQIYPSKKEGTPFQISNWPHLRNMIIELEKRNSVAVLCEAEGMTPSPFSAPDYPNPPECVATDDM